MKKHLQHSVFILLALFMFSSIDSRSQTTITIQTAGDSAVGLYCGTPFTVQYMINGIATGYTASDSISIYTAWGDGNDTTVYYHLTGPTSQFWVSYNHTYQFPGVYSTLNIVTGPDGNADTLLNINDIIGSSSCGNIDGRLYVDANSNCVYDIGETVVANVPVQLLLSNVTIAIAYTGSNGYYYFNEPNNNYTIQPGSQISNYGYTVTCPVSGQINISGVPSVNNNFGLVCTPGFDLVSQVWSQRFRPGFTSHMYPYFYNNNCQPVSGQAKLILANPLITYTSAATPPDAISGDTLIWNFSNLSNQSYLWLGPVYVLTSLAAPLGDSICVTLLVEPTSGDVNPANNTLTICRPIVNAIDPNEKDVSPHGNIVSGSWLTYTVFFQNTGNDTAYHVFILDTIDANLNMNTFQPVGASHSYYTYIENGNVVKFDFPNIMLVDSNMNEPLSHGWVTYRIKTLNGLSNGTVINNTAGIYFDFNAPIITNTTVNAIDNSVSVSDINSETGSITIYPNPVGNQLAISNRQFAISSIDIYDVLGQKVYNGQLTNSNRQLTINVSDLNPGIYFVKARGEKMERVVKFVKE